MILNSRFVLTAAHCVHPELKHMSVGFGNDNDLYKIFDAGRIKVKRYVIHPGYTAGGQQDTPEEYVLNDIAILELEKPIDFDDYVQAGCIQKAAMSSYPNDHLLTAGYGLINPFVFDNVTGRGLPGNTLSRLLKEVELKDVSSTAKKCLDNKSLVCANSINEGESSCKGDSGTLNESTDY